MRPIGRPAVDMLEADRPREAVGPVFRGFLDGKALIGFAFDPERKAILLVAGDKSGGSEKRSCQSLVAQADRSFRAHLDRLAVAKKGQT